MKQIHYYDIDNDWTYQSSEPAYLDEVETKKQGRNVYFCPFNATLVELPSLKAYEVARFNGISWDVVKDYRNQFAVNSSMEVINISELGELPDGYVLITENQSDRIISDKDYYIISDGKLVENPNYQSILIERRREGFRKEFFQTSLGWIRRTVTNLNGSTMNFLTEVKPSLEVGYPILAYNEPDFTEDVTDWKKYQKPVLVTEQFLEECKIQFAIDFYGYNPLEAGGGN